MRKVGFRILLCLALLGAAPRAQAAVAQGGRGAQPQYKAGELLVKFRPGVAADRAAEAHRAAGAARLREFGELRLHHVKVPGRIPLEQALRAYQANPNVEYAEPNYLWTTAAVPADPRFGELWGLRNTGQTGGVPGADIAAAAAWGVTTGSSGTVVAVIDTGVDYNHEDLRENVWTNPGEIPGNGIDDDGNGYVDDVHGMDAANQDGDPMDDNRHGTHVAGTIGAAANNGVGIAGVAWNVKIVACKFLSADGTGSTDAAVECLLYVKALRDRGVNVIATSNSWGGGPYSQVLRDAIDAQRDVLFIAAAGNAGRDNDATASYPASYPLPNIVAVAATDATDAKASFSNYGKRSVHVAAPGVDILSAVPGAGTYELLSGTSMATPHVTGLAVLLKAANPTRDWRALRNLILAGGDPVPNLAGQTVTGRRIDANGSLTCSSASVFRALEYPVTGEIGSETTLRAISVTCAQPVGPVTATLSTGTVVPLRDDGLYPDQAAGDGVFSGAWVPYNRSASVTFASPLGSETVAVAFPSLKLLTLSVPEPELNQFYSATFLASGGVGPYGWTVTGALPPGLAFNGITGVLSGVPTQAGQYPVTVTVTDQENVSQSASLVVSVVGDPFSVAWTATYDTGTDEYGLGVAVDAAGNVYAAGYQYGGGVDAVLRKYGPAGDLLWSRVYGAADQMEQAQDVAVDGAGNVYVAGSAAGNGLLLKYDAAGTLVWSRQYPSISGRAVAVSRQGEVYLAGAGSFQGVVVKYDPYGNQVWVSTAGLGEFSPLGAATDSGGDVHVTGSWTGDGYFGENDAKTARIAWNGEELWQSLYNGDPLNYDEQYGTDVAVDEAGNVYVAGLSSAYDAAGVGHSDYLLMKYDAAGALVWKRFVAGAGNVATGIALDGTGSLYVVGRDGQAYPIPLNDVTVFKLDGSGLMTGKTVRDLAQGRPDYAEDVAVDGQGNTYVVGSARNASGTWDLLVAKLPQAAALAVTAPAALPDAALSETYAFDLTALGASGALAWSVTQGALPAGLTLNAATGRISGKPTAAGSFPFTVQAAASGATAVKALSLRVFAPWYVKASCAAKTFKSGPQTATVLAEASSCATGDTVSWTYNGGPMNHLVGYLANGGYSQDAVIRGAAVGANLSFYSKDAAGTGTVQLVEANPSTGAVARVLATLSVPLTAGQRAYVTNLSGLQGTVRAGYTAGIQLATTTGARSLTETRWGRANGGPGLEQWFSLTETLLPVNHAPVAEANGPYSAYAYDLVSVSSEGTYDPDGDELTYFWECGDGSYSTGPSSACRYFNPGTYTVRLTVTDPRGASGTDTATVTVLARTQAPVANAGPDQTVQVRKTIALDGSGSYDPDGTVTSYEWNLGDGRFLSGPVVSTSYRRAGTYLVTLTVTDNAGAQATDTCLITVQ